jgi:hypothetical protein
LTFTATTGLASVPEPASLLFFGTGLAGLGFLAHVRRPRLLAKAGSLLLTAGLGSAATLSFTGTLTSPDVGPGALGVITFDLAASSTVTLQTYSFGVGINGAGTIIAPRGFDPFVGLFAGGAGPTALFIDGTADNLSNYTSEPSACPPAGLVTIGSATGQCGDVRLQFNLAPGFYTVIVSDADYVPNAVYETTGYLGDGFSDLTGGSFPLTTCYDASDCNKDTAHWALDITTSGGASSSAPEPGSFALIGVGLTLFGASKSRLLGKVTFEKRRKNATR